MSAMKSGCRCAGCAGRRGVRDERARILALLAAPETVEAVAAAIAECGDQSDGDYYLRTVASAALDTVRALIEGDTA